MEKALDTVQAALEDVPEEKRWSRWWPGVASGAASLLFVIVVAASVAWALNESDDATLSPTEVAPEVKAERGAELASCDQVKDVEGSFECELTYVADARSCKLSPAEASAPQDFLLAAAAAQGAGESATGGGNGACLVEATSREDVHVDAYDDDPRWRFTVRRAELATYGVDKKEKESLRQKWRRRMPRVVTGAQE